MKNNVNINTVSIYSDLPSGGAKRLYSNNLSYIKEKYKVTEYSDKKHTSRIRNILQYYAYIFKSLIIIPEVVKEINKSKLLIAYSSWVTKSPIILRHITIPTIYICHEPPREFYDQLYIETFSFKEKVVNIVGRIIKKIDYDNINYRRKQITIISNSKKSQKDIRDAYGLDSIIIYPGVDVSRYINKNLFESRKNQVISVGALNKLKNQMHILKSLSEIPLESRPKLILVGNGGDNSYINKLIAFAKKNKIKLKIFQNISNKKLAKLYSESKVFLYSPINEPFGLVILEAMAAGLPIVAHNSGGYSELVGDKNGYIINNLDPINWARHIEILLTEKTLWKKISKSNIRLADSNSLERMNLKLNTIIKKILG